MTDTLRRRLEQLSEIQRTAADWGDGAALVLAGPGAGKTGVLTARIARLLEQSQPRKFKVLALTFTTKAANEMRDRVSTLVPDLVDRTFIGTFHAFCAAVLRQHGSHIGLQPDFGIYDQDNDRRAMLVEVAARAGLDGMRAGDLLPTIDRLKQNLIVPERTIERYRDQDVGERVARVFAVYEQALRVENRMDFNGLILEACRLVVKVPTVAQRLRQTYPYWLIDEFQDTSPAQYRMLRAWAGDGFKNVFAVADDDQIIYQWAGASFRQLEKFREHFTPTLIQLVENHRCPASIVSAANLLVAQNTQRTSNKQPLVAMRPDGVEPIATMTFDSDETEAEGVAGLIAAQPPETWRDTAVIARGRAQLATILDKLRSRNVSAAIAERRGRFVSPQFVWLQACLDQALRPSDRRTFMLLAETGERVLQLGLNPDALEEEAEAAGISFLEQWAVSAGIYAPATAQPIVQFATMLVSGRAKWRVGLAPAIAALIELSKVDHVVPTDVEEDLAAWQAAETEIKREKGADPELAEFLQGLALRSKSPPQDPRAVSLLTVHASKGLEFDHVYVVGMAESVFPSFQSVQKGPASPEMEEERRNCFVAVTRTKKNLVLSRAERYRGFQRAPSRFLEEMGLA